MCKLLLLGGAIPKVAILRTQRLAKTVLGSHMPLSFGQPAKLHLDTIDYPPSTNFSSPGTKRSVANSVTAAISHAECQQRGR